MNGLQVRMRPELIVTPQGLAADRRWVVHDPVTLQYFLLRDEEWSILRMLDGRRSLEEIRRQFERQFSPLRLGAQQLQAFLYRLHEFGLVVGDGTGQGEVLCQRMRSHQRSALIAALGNPLAIRLPGLPAKQVVELLYPYARWMFSPQAVTFALLLVASALLLLIGEVGAAQSRLPSFNSFFNLRTAGWFAIALIATKALHELGHALTARHFGARCREFGVMLLLFMPTLYCDVSDAWRLPSKWQRMLVSAAGMITELVVASLATWIWWLSAPGTLNAICLRIMFLCSISTLLFNLNPLLRYDGYYILSDWLNVPNLWQESRALWRRIVVSWLSKSDLPVDPTIPGRMYPVLLLYGVSSIIYSWLLLIAMMWFCWNILEPQGLGAIANALIDVTLCGMASGPIYRLVNRWSHPAARPRIHRGRASLLVLLTACLVAVLVVLPMPHRITAPAWIEAAGAEAVYVSVPGRLHDSVMSAAAVNKNETLIQLTNADIEIRVAQLASEVRQEQMRVTNLNLLLSDDPTVAPLIPAADKALQDARERWRQAQNDLESLNIKAPRAGNVLPPPHAAHPPDDSKGLNGWLGTPLDSANRGCFLDIGTVVCQIGDPQSVEAMLIIEQSSIPFVKVGQQVRLRIQQGPVQVVDGEVSELAKADVSEIPSPLVNALDLPVRREGKKGARTAATYYQARVKLKPTDAPLAIGMLGEAKVLSNWQPLGKQLLRWLQLTFWV